MLDEDSIESYFDRLWPICRSITGHGIRQSLDILAELMPMERLRFPSGTKVFDWTVPDEWNPKDAYIVDPNGRRRASFNDNSLHLLGYSRAFRGTLTLDELKEHLYSLPEQPDAIPYLTSYYSERWGFCLAHREFESLPAGRYTVVVDTDLAPGTLEMGEAVLPGESNREIFFSTYLCHPSLASNELSGPLVVAHLYKRLAERKNRKLTYRFLVTAETIGAISYLSVRGQHLREQLVAGYQVTCVGDDASFTYKKSRQADSLSDRAALAFGREQPAFRIEDFDPADGSDERQWCSPGFNLPVGSLMRTMYGRFPQYHTSLDDKAFVSMKAMSDTVSAYEQLVKIIEANICYVSRFPNGEPQLGKRGLYPSLGSQKTIQDRVRAMQWLLNLADGKHDLLAISERSRQPISTLMDLAGELTAKGLIDEHRV